MRDRYEQHLHFCRLGPAIFLQLGRHDRKKGWKPKPLQTMLRIYLLKVWFSLSDEGAEDAI